MNAQSYVDKIENYRYNKHMNKCLSVKTVLKQTVKQVVRLHIIIHKEIRWNAFLHYKI